VTSEVNIPSESPSAKQSDPPKQSDPNGASLVQKESDTISTTSGETSGEALLKSDTSSTTSGETSADASGEASGEASLVQKESGTKESGTSGETQTSGEAFGAASGENPDVAAKAAEFKAVADGTKPAVPPTDVSKEGKGKQGLSGGAIVGIKSSD
jgi:hypothetical protein